MITVKGFPTQVGKYIELPDMAELLVYPYFVDNYIDDVYRKSPSFLKYLLDQVPLKGNKKYISVRSEVKFIHPQSRSCTNHYSAPTGHALHDFEWHIDSDISLELYNEETDIVHLLSSDVECLSDFNKNEFTLDLDPATPYQDFIEILGRECRDKIIPQKAEPNRIITFTNHLHRAKPSTQHELRYMLRVVESDRDREPSHPTETSMSQSTVFDTETRTWTPTIRKHGSQVDLQWRKDR